MESLTNTNGATVYVDYAHNYDSLKNLLTFVREEHPDGRLIVLVGSTGDKAISRRKDFGTVLSELADVAVLTTDDPPVKIQQNLPRNSSPYYQRNACLHRFRSWRSNCSRIIFKHNG